MARGPRTDACPPGTQGMGSWSWLAGAGSPELGAVLVFGAFLLFFPSTFQGEFKLFLHPQAILVPPSVFLPRHWHHPWEGWH